MSHPYKGFEPNWVRGEIPKDSYRSIFKWGNPLEIKSPKESLFRLMKEKFGMTDADFQTYTEDIGFDKVKFDLPISLKDRDLDAFRAIVGGDFVGHARAQKFIPNSHGLLAVFDDGQRLLD